MNNIWRLQNCIPWMFTFMSCLNTRSCFVYMLCRYTVFDLTAERQYQVTLHVGLCLEAHSPCIFETTVFKNTLLPKNVCKLYSGFAHASKSKYIVYSYCVIIWFQLFDMAPFVIGNGWNKWKLYMLLVFYDMIVYLRYLL